jgi:hypothetical protein
MTDGQPRPLADSDPRQLGRFNVLGLLGESGMGRVFFGRSPGKRQPLTTAAANGSNRIALMCPRSSDINPLTCLDDPY